MALDFAQLAAVCFSSWIVWRVVRGFVLRTPLDNIPGPTPHSLLTGDMSLLYHRHDGWAFNKSIGEKYFSVARVKGLCGANVLLVSDPSAIHHMLMQDGVLYNYSKSMQASADLVFGPGLLSVKGSQHRKQRKMLNPVFSTDSMRRMTPIFYSIARKLNNVISAKLDSGVNELDILLLLSNAALEFISQAGMGHTFDLIRTDSDVESLHPMAHAVKSVAPVQTELALWWLLLAFFQKLGTPQFRRRLADLVIAVVPDNNLDRMRDIVNTMDRIVKEIFCKRSEEVDSSTLKGDPKEAGDSLNMLSILLRANKLTDEASRLTDEEFQGQMTTLLFAGTDTSSGTLGRILQQLATRQDAQEKLRDEFEAARDYPGQDLSYDKLNELPYLDAICRETLRVYSPVNLLPRETLKDVVMPLHTPIIGVDGSEMREVPVPKGTLILPAYWQCNTNKDLWGPDAFEWKPERWLNPLPESLLKARVPGVYSNLMSFGGGPRACIGFRFAQLEIKILLSILIPSFKFSLTDKEVFWNWSTIPYPTMDKESVEPSLVLKLEPLTPSQR